jgi:hypothetical protein
MKTRVVNLDSTTYEVTWGDRPLVVAETELTFRVLKINRTYRLCRGAPIKSSTFFGKRTQPASGDPVLALVNKTPFTGNVGLSLLKSALQKCIRRQNSELALRVCKTMLTMSPTSLLRRLVIILCEDVLPEPQPLMALVWLYAASLKGYQLRIKDADYILSCVKAHCIYDAYVPPKLLDETVIDTHSTTDAAEAIQLYTALTQFTLQFDRKMMNGVFKYLNGPAQETKVTVALERGLFDETPHITLDEYPLYGIDFHNARGCLPYLAAVCKTTDQDAIKRTLWLKRSGVNTRKPQVTSEEAEELWPRIDKTMDRFARKHLLRVLEPPLIDKNPGQYESG